VPDDQLSLAIGKDGLNARLAARLTGWRVDIRSETEFAEEESELGYTEEDVAGRCACILANGKRCPNASLPGSRYCGLPAHQALEGTGTDYLVPPEEGEEPVGDGEDEAAASGNGEVAEDSADAAVADVVAAEDAPVEEAVAEDAPVEEAVAEEAPVEEAAVEDSAAADQPLDEEPVADAEPVAEDEPAEAEGEPAVAEDEALAEDESVAEDEPLAEQEAPAEDETAADAEAPDENEPAADEEAPAVEAEAAVAAEEDPAAEEAEER
jgi:N utilization substance protein A